MMSTAPFAPCIVTAATRTAAISRASWRVVYCGPGISASELEALLIFRKRCPDSLLLTLVDLTPETFQAGYWGEFEPSRLKQLLDLGSHGSHAAGWRIGILIANDVAFLYAPTPLSLESDRTETPTPNGFRLGPDETLRLYNSIVSSLIKQPPLWPSPVSPQSTAATVIDVDAGSSRTVPSAAAVEAPQAVRQAAAPAPITADQINKVVQDLARSNYTPPSKKRQLERLRERLVIVNFEVSGYQLSRRILQLPREVIDVLGSTEKTVNERLLASWRLFRGQADDDVAQAQALVDKQFAELKKKYLKPLLPYGHGLAVNVQRDFEQEWADFQAKRVKEYQVKLREKVQDLIDDSKSTLEGLLRERADGGQLRVPPRPSLIKLTRQEELELYIADLVDSVNWPQVQDVVEAVRFSMWYVDIAPALLNDRRFVGKLEKAFNFKLSQLAD